MFAGLALLLASLWVRTDNVLFVVAVLIWLTWRKELSLPQFAVLAGLAGASVLFINHSTSNYGWGVLFRHSFVEGGGSVADLRPTVSLSEYLTAVVAGIRKIGGQEVTMFALIGLAAVKWLRTDDWLRPLLTCVAIASIARFLLFPAPDNRYFIWGYLIAGAALIRAIAIYAPAVSAPRTGERSLDEQSGAVDGAA
jgi:hypothetical protein